jgi:SAM domain (Sterile alpha motif)
MYDPAISTILMGVGAEETIPLFEKANVTMKMFLLLTDDDLKNIGVQLSPTRNEILGGIKNFHLKEWSEASVPQMAGNAIR